MIDPKIMTAERYRSLLDSVDADVNDIDVAIIEGPAIVTGRERPLLLLDPMHYEQFDKVRREI